MALEEIEAADWRQFLTDPEFVGENPQLAVDEIIRLRAALAEARELIDELNCQVDSWSATNDLKAKAVAFLDRAA